MSELISRNELLKRFCINKDGHRIPERDCDNFEVTVSVKDIKTIIKEQPIAYDIGKVIEELESEKRYGSKYDSYYEENLYRGEMFENDVNNKTIDKAIEIVKQGEIK